MFLNAREDLVELGLAHQESVVLRPDIVAGINKVQGQLIAYGYCREGAKKEGDSRPRIALRNKAEAFLSRAATIVWLSFAAIVYASPTLFAV